MRSDERTKTKAQHINSVVQTVIQNLTVANAPDKNPNLSQQWQAVLSEEEVLHTQISELNHDTLVVRVDSSARAYQLNLKKHGLLKQLNKKRPEIKDIYFKVGKIK